MEEHVGFQEESVISLAAKMYLGLRDCNIHPNVLHALINPMDCYKQVIRPSFTNLYVLRDTYNLSRGQLFIAKPNTFTCFGNVEINKPPLRNDIVLLCAGMTVNRPLRTTLSPRYTFRVRRQAICHKLHYLSGRILANHLSWTTLSSIAYAACQSANRCFHFYFILFYLACTTHWMARHHSLLEVEH